MLPTSNVLDGFIASIIKLSDTITKIKINNGTTPNNSATGELRSKFISYSLLAQFSQNCTGDNIWGRRENGAGKSTPGYAELNDSHWSIMLNAYEKGLLKSIEFANYYKKKLKDVFPGQITDPFLEICEVLWIIKNHLCIYSGKINDSSIQGEIATMLSKIENLFDLYRKDFSTLFIHQMSPDKVTKFSKYAKPIIKKIDLQVGEDRCPPQRHILENQHNSLNGVANGDMPGTIFGSTELSKSISSKGSLLDETSQAQTSNPEKSSDISYSSEADIMQRHLFKSSNAAKKNSKSSSTVIASKTRRLSSRRNSVEIRRKHNIINARIFRGNIRRMEKQQANTEKRLDKSSRIERNRLFNLHKSKVYAQGNIYSYNLCVENYIELLKKAHTLKTLKEISLTAKNYMSIFERQHAKALTINQKKQMEEIKELYSIQLNKTRLEIVNRCSAKAKDSSNITDQFMQMPPKQNISYSQQVSENDVEWFTCDEISRLLDHFFEHKNAVRLIQGINVQDLHGANTLVQNIDDAQVTNLQESTFAGIPTINNIIIPVNLSNKHWVALHIRFHSDNRLSPLISYVDPLANDMPASLKENLYRLYPELEEKNIFVSNIKYQIDGYNCGPWTVAILNCLVNQGKFPAKDFDIEAARKNYRQILNLKKTSSMGLLPQFGLIKEKTALQQTMGLPLNDENDDYENIEKYETAIEELLQAQLQVDVLCVSPDDASQLDVEEYEMALQILMKVQSKVDLFDYDKCVSKYNHSHFVKANLKP